MMLEARRARRPRNVVEPFEPSPEVVALSTDRLQEIVLRNDPNLRCRTTSDADEFFTSQTAVHARRMCSGCPIREQCAELAIREEGLGYISGIRGGLSPRERRALIRRRRGTPEVETGRDWRLTL